MKCLMSRGTNVQNYLLYPLYYIGIYDFFPY